MRPFREQNKTVIGAIGIGLILLFLVGAFKTDSLPLIGAGPTYKADFTEAAGLQKMDEVRVAGVKVGKVTGISLDKDHVVVTMRIKGAHLGALTSAAIKIKTVLGRKYIALVPDGDGTLTKDIPVSRTTSPFDVSPAFQQFAGDLGKVNVPQVAASFTVLADDFRNSGPQVKQTLSGLSRLSQTISSRDAKLQVLLTHAKTVTTTLANRDTDIVSFMNDSNVILQELHLRRDAIHRLLTTTQGLSEQLTGLVRENRASLKPALANLKGVVDVLQANEGNLDKSLAELAPFTRLFANNLGNGRWFDTYVTNLTNLSGFTPGTFGSGS